MLPEWWFHGADCAPVCCRNGRNPVGGTEALVADLEEGFAGDCKRSGDVAQMAWMGATAADGATATALAGVVFERGEAEQGRGLEVVEASEFGQVSTEADGIDRVKSGDAADDDGAAGERGVGRDGRVRIPVCGGLGSPPRSGSDPATAPSRGQGASNPAATPRPWRTLRDRSRCGFR